MRVLWMDDQVCVFCGWMTKCTCSVGGRLSVHVLWMDD